jgi:hypothetical protein
VKRMPVTFLRARLAALFLLSLTAVYGVGLALAPAKMHRPVQLAWPPLALGMATLGGAALMDRLYMIVDRAGRGRLQLLSWIAYGLLLLLVGLGILSGEKGQDAVRRGADLMRVVQVGFLLLAGLGRGHLGALLNAFAMTCISALGGGPAAAVAIAAHAGFIVFFLVADHHARLLTDYPVDALPEPGPVLRQAAVMGGALAVGLALFFWLVPCEPYAPLVARGGIRSVVPPEQAWRLVRDLIGLTLLAGLAFWLVLWLGGGKGGEVEVAASRSVAARRESARRPAPVPPPEAPDPKGWRARIVKLYVRLAGQLARLGVQRGAAQTPLEFSRALAPPGAAASLTELFDRARYGDRDLGEADFDAASSAGAQILDHFRGKK